MRVLYVAPYPLSRVRIRGYGFVSQLAKHHDVKVLVLCASKREQEDVRVLQREGIEIIAIQERRIQKVARILRTWRKQLPLQVVYDASPRLRDAITTLLETEHFDLLHVEFVRALGALPEELTVPVVWDAVDCISELYEHGARFGATPMLRLVGRNEARRVRAYEQAQLRRFRQVLVTSERDRQGLLELVSEETDVSMKSAIADIMVLPHGIDRDYFRPSTEVRQPETLIFSGKMSFHANVAGVLMLVKHILPLIWEQRPNVRLVIAGSKPPAIVRRLAQDRRITVTGYVPDIRPYIAHAQIAVSSLPYAVGIQNKILEAMALGTPVVASSSAAAGLQAVAGHDLLVADTAEAFAAAVLQLLDDQLLWKELAKNGLQYTSTHHDWEKIMKRLIGVYERAIGVEHEMAL